MSLLPFKIKNGVFQEVNNHKAAANLSLGNIESAGLIKSINGKSQNKLYLDKQLYQAAKQMAGSSELIQAIK